MTNEQRHIMNQALKSYCDITKCRDCPLIEIPNCCTTWNPNLSDEKLYETYMRVFGNLENNNNEAVTSNDPANPKHYKREGGIESIEEMIAVFGKEAVAHFCLCNVWKYRYRAADKNGEEDINKSDWYMRKYLELTGKVGGVAHE